MSPEVTSVLPQFAAPKALLKAEDRNAFGLTVEAILLKKATGEVPAR